MYHFKIFTGDLTLQGFHTFKVNATIIDTDHVTGGAYDTSLLVTVDF